MRPRRCPSRSISDSFDRSREKCDAAPLECQSLWRLRAGIRSKQRYLHELAFLDEVDFRGNLNVSVRLRHARDVARRLERRHRRAINYAHSVKLVPAGGRDYT